MTITFNQEPVDLYVLSLYVGWDSPDRSRFRIFSNTLPILVLIGIAAWMYGSDSLDPIMGTTLILLAVASIFLMPRLVRWMQIRRIDNMIKRHPKPELLVGPRSVTYGEESLQMQIGDRASTFQWADSQGWVEIEEHYLIFVKANVALVVPKRAFNYGSEEQSFLELLQQKLGPARHSEKPKSAA